MFNIGNNIVITGYVSFKYRGLDLGSPPDPPVRFAADEYFMDKPGKRRLAWAWGNLLVSFGEIDFPWSDEDGKYRTWESVVFDVFVDDGTLDNPRLRYDSDRRWYSLGFDITSLFTGLGPFDRWFFRRRLRRAAAEALAKPDTSRRFAAVLKEAALKEVEDLRSKGHLLHRPSLEVLENLLANSSQEELPVADVVQLHGGKTTGKQP